MRTSESTASIFAALAAAQAELEPAVKDAQNPHLRNRYADLGSVWDACRAALHRHGLAILQGAQRGDKALGYGGEVEFERWQLVTRLVHSSGEWVESDCPLIYGESKGVNPMQSLGSAITYARRYGLAAMVGVVPDDDDGHAAAPAKPRQQTQQPANGHHQPQQSPLDATLNRAIDAWHAFEPVRDEDEMKARKWRLLHGACSTLIKAEEIDARSVLSDEIDDEGNPKRDRKKVWNALKRLHDAKPGVVARAIEGHVASKRTQKVEAN